MTVRVFEAIADAFVTEGVEGFFVLMGDGNMHLTSALHDRGVRCIHMRHEHSVCSSAMSYASARDDVGVCSVTHGPGFTQIMTALVTAVRARIPLVIFVGETPLGAVWHNQQLDQAPFAEAAGVPYLPVRKVEDAMDVISRAFDMARSERRPVIVAMPADLQTMTAALPPYKSTKAKHPQPRKQPAADAVKALAARIATARRPIVVVGKGALLSDAVEDAGRLADRCGALIGTTLLAKGALDDHPFSLGVVGGFGSPVAHKLGKECDLVIGLGAGLNTFTLYSGKLFPNAAIAQVDIQPRGDYQGLPPPDLRIEGDCKATIAALLKELDAIKSNGVDWRSPEIADAIASSGFDVLPVSPENSTLDPRHVVEKFGDVLPADWEVVGGTGHCAYFLTHMQGREAGRFKTIRDFGAIGNGLAYAIGIAVAKPQSNVVLFEGDGGLLMHIQELETIRRHGLKILVCAMNDGGSGSEIHVLREHGLDESIARFGWEDFSRIAIGFGLDGANISNIDQIPQLLHDFQMSDRSAVWNFHLSDKIRWTLLPIHPMDPAGLDH